MKDNELFKGLGIIFTFLVMMGVITQIARMWGWW